jgi:predicted phage tail protein
MRYLTVVMLASLMAVVGCAVMRAPSIDEFVSPDSPRVSWLPVQGAVTYEVQIARNPGFTGEVKTLSAGADASAPLDGVVEHNKYYSWRVRAIDSSGFRGRWSATGYFILNLPVPQPISPVGEITDPKPIMKWEKTASAARYVVQVSSDDLFRSPEDNYETAAKDYFPPENAKLEVGRQYYWRVRAVDAQGALSAWSKYIAFKIVKSSQALTLGPAKGEVVKTLKPTFSWSAHKNATNYQVEVILADQVGAEEPEAVALALTKGAETSLTLTNDLKPDTSYAWRVRPIMKDSPPLPWSEWETFRTPKP